MQLHFKMGAYFHVVERQSTQKPGLGVGKVSFICCFTPQMSTTAMAGQAKARTLDIHPGLTKWVQEAKYLSSPVLPPGML